MWLLVVKKLWTTYASKRYEKCSKTVVNSICEELFLKKSFDQDKSCQQQLLTKAVNKSSEQNVFKKSNQKLRKKIWTKVLDKNLWTEKNCELKGSFEWKLWTISCTKQP